MSNPRYVIDESTLGPDTFGADGSADIIGQVLRQATRREHFPLAHGFGDMLRRDYPIAVLDALEVPSFLYEPHQGSLVPSDATAELEHISDLFLTCPPSARHLLRSKVKGILRLHGAFVSFVNREVSHVGRPKHGTKIRSAR